MAEPTTEVRTGVALSTLTNLRLGGPARELVVARSEAELMSAVAEGDAAAVPVLVLGAPDDAESVRAAVAFGARGYLRWDASPIEMGLGLSRVGLRPEGARIPQQGSNGHLVGASSWSGAAPLAGSAPTTVRSTVRDATPAVALSMREMQVLTGMSQGKSNAQIGRELYLSEDTIKTHARRLFRKLGAKDRAEAVATGFRRGIMT